MAPCLPCVDRARPARKKVSLAHTIVLAAPQVTGTSGRLERHAGAAMSKATHHLAMPMEKPKRFRANSISGRLRSLSELVEEGVIESRQKGVFKDMIIAEDPRVTNSISEYHDKGNPEPIQVLLRDGFLNRKSSLDVLGDPADISFDFFHVTGLSSSVNSDTSLHEELDIEFHLRDDSKPQGAESIIISYNRRESRGDVRHRSFDLQASLNSPPPELFGGIFDEQPVRTGSFAPGARLHRDSIAALDDLDLPSSLMPPPRATALPPLPPPARSSGRNTASSSGASGHASSSAEAKHHKSTAAAPIAIPQRAAKPPQRAPRSAKAPAMAVPSGSAFADDYVPSRSKVDSGMLVGAYSPEARKQRVARFVEKRERRVWRKKVKYDVRKNFADSRLRVKGRFVRKEDESLLRDLMSMC